MLPVRHALPVLVLLAACGEGQRVEYGEGEGTLTTRGPAAASDDGEVCDACSVAVVSDAPVAFKVAYFIGTAELHDETVYCDVDLDGSTITVHSSASLILEDGVYDRSASTFVDCPSPPLPDGVYTVRFGDREKTLTVPSLPCNACQWEPYDESDLDCYEPCF